jgi:hypothetical protein
MFIKKYYICNGTSYSFKLICFAQVTSLMGATLSNMELQDFMKEADKVRPGLG